MQSAINGIVRHVLTALGGGIVASGYLDEALLQTAIGALITLGGVAWSVWEKARAKRKSEG